MANTLCKVLDRYEFWCWAVFTASYLGWAVVAATKKGYWFDELVTHYVDILPDWSAVWNALRIGADANPPLMHAFNRAILAVAGDTPAALRASSIFGVWLACFCLYWIVRRKSPAATAWIAALFPLLSGASAYAIEARPYGLVLGFTALAYLCWQRRGLQQGWTLGLALSVAALVSCHYYAVFATIPFWCAEAFRLWRSRRLDWANPLALAAGYLPLIFYWPMIAGARQYSANAFAMPSWGSLSEVYGFLLGSSIPLLAVVLAWLLYQASHRSMTLAWRLTITETVLAISFCVLPLAIVLIGRFITHGLLPRYTLPALVGMSVVAALLAEVAFSRLQMALLLVALAGYIGVERGVSLRGLPPERAFEWTQQTAIEPSLPVVHGSSTQYVELFQSAPAELRERFYTLADPVEQGRRTGSTAEDLGALHLMPISPLHVEKPAAFLAAHRRFYFIQPPIRNAWVLAKLIEDGADARLLAASPASTLYMVTMKAGQ